MLLSADSVKIPCDTKLTQNIAVADFPGMEGIRFHGQLITPQKAYEIADNCCIGCFGRRTRPDSYSVDVLGALAFNCATYFVDCKY